MNNIDRLKHSGYIIAELMTKLKKADSDFYLSNLIFEANNFLKDLEDNYDWKFKKPRIKNIININITDEELDELRGGKVFNWNFNNQKITIKNENEE